MTRKRASIGAFFILTVGLIARFPYKGSEDIMAARRSILSGTKRDFWGSFSPWFFSIAPESIWEACYAILFSMLIAISTFIFLRRYPSKQELPKRSKFLILVSAYFSMLFTLSFSRDGAMLAFIWFAIALWWKAETTSKRIVTWLLIFSSLLFLILGTSFRPWLALASPLLLGYFYSAGRKVKLLFNSSYILILVTVLITISPFIVETSFHKFLGMKDSYPEQQVMIMDLSTIACLSADRQTSDEALLNLNLLAESPPLTKKSLCSQYYPASWASVVYYGAASGEKGALQDLQIGDREKYLEFRSNYISFLTKHFAALIQAKFLLGSQFLLAGDSPRLGNLMGRAVFEYPMELAKGLRVFSLLPSLFLLSLFGIYRVRKMEISRSMMYLILAYYCCSVSIVVIAFIGDNQRYILPFQIISFLLFFLGSKQDKRCLKAI